MSSSMKRPSDAMAEESVDPQYQVLVVSNNLGARINYIKDEFLPAVRLLCRASQLAKGLPDPTADPTKSRLSKLELMLRWLETSVEMTPALKKDSQIEGALELLFDRPQFHFEERTRERARQLYERWKSQNWGQGEVVEESSDDEASVSSDDEVAPSAKRKKSSTKSTSSTRKDSARETTIRLPPKHHPIFGENGIMHGLVLSNSTHRNYLLDQRYEKRQFKVFGHNGLQAGQWWPIQHVALFHGAHGSKNGGISGNSETGAYSVVASGSKYEELDEDRGDTLYYSGSGSHDNKDPKKPAKSTDGTNALKASHRTQNPVRVLRAAGSVKSKSKKSWRPSVGIRYDGLYHVVDMVHRINKKGGMYEQFVLKRLGNQPPLDNNKSRPTPSEIQDFFKREDGY